MDPFNQLINQIDKLLDENNNDSNKVENIIINNHNYSKLDMDEKQILNETIKDKIDLKMKNSKEKLNFLRINYVIL